MIIGEESEPAHSDISNPDVSFKKSPRLYINIEDRAYEEYNSDNLTKHTENANGLDSLKEYSNDCSCCSKTRGKSSVNDNLEEQGRYDRGFNDEKLVSDTVY